MSERDVGELVAHHAGGDLSPEARGLEHVGLVDRREVLLAPPGQARGHADDPLDLADGVNAQIGGAVGVPPLLAEVDPPRQLADDDHVDAFQHLRAQRRGGEQHGIHRHRPEVRVEPEALADGEQALLGPHLAPGVIPLWSAHRAEEHRVRGPRRLEGGLG